MLYYRKKESNKKHYIRIIVIIAIILLSKFVPMANKLTSNAMLTVLRPINQVTSFITNEVQGLIDSVFGTKANRDLVEKLTTENNSLQQEINQLQTIVNDEELLKKEYEMSKITDYNHARVIALDDKTTFNSFIIDKGSKHGIEQNDIVVGAYVYKDGNSYGALIGKVEETFDNTAKVISIMDDKFNLTFMHKNTNKFGVINGRFAGLLEGYMLDKTTEVTVDDDLLTSGIGGVYNQGILIGKIVEVTESPDELSKLVKVKSPIDFNRIYNVFVIKNAGDKNE